MRELQDAPVSMIVEEYQNELGHLRFLKTVYRGLPKLLLIHGAPGSFEAWERYYLDPDIHSQWDIIAFDRPGYGGSNQGKVILDIDQQSRLIWDAAGLKEGEKALIVAHSYGGPVAAWMGIIEPEKTEALILLAPSMSADAEPIFWFNYLTGVPPLYWLLPQDLKNSSDEKFSHLEELRIFDQGLPRLQVPTIYFQGTADGLVPLGNTDYVRAMAPSEFLDFRILQDEDHFLPWSHYEDVKAEIIQWGQTPNITTPSPDYGRKEDQG
jgi:pimeloyl-ACP methyl ester carboxylesterase